MSEQITHGDLPHWYKPGHAHFVTYRVAGSLPTQVLRELKQERERQIKQPCPASMAPHEHRARIHKQMFAKYDARLDLRSGFAPLKADIADIIQRNLYHHHGSKYELISYCVMPNHVHVLLQPFQSALAICQAEAYEQYGMETADGPSVLSHIMHSLKSYTATQANRLLQRQGRFWQPESYDHWVRATDELERIVAYIAGNPVKAGLCQEPQQWRYSSAYDRFHQDGSDSAIVGWLRDDWQR